MYTQEQSAEHIKDCTKAVTFCFLFDDFCSKNGLPASIYKCIHICFHLTDTTTRTFTRDTQKLVSYY